VSQHGGNVRSITAFGFVPHTLSPEAKIKRLAADKLATIDDQVDNRLAQNWFAPMTMDGAIELTKDFLMVPGFCP
jgi:hypothetical protein